MTRTAKSNSSVFVVKSQNKSLGTKQKENRFSGVNGIQEYNKYGPDECIFAYEESFILGGAVDRIATSASSGFIFPDGIDSMTKDALEGIDLQFVFKNLYITGNCFLEKVMSMDGTRIVDIRPFLTDEVRIQKIEKNEGDKPIKTIQYVQSAGLGDKVEFSKDSVIHIKLSSMRSRYYGDSKIGRVIPQVLLLAFIEKYYSKLFEKGVIKNTILADRDRKLTPDDKKAIKVAIEDYMKGIDNAFSTMILPGDISLVADLGKDIDDGAFLNLRDKLIESVSIGLNIPIDILLSNQSNRNTKSESLEELNRDIAIPLQNVLMKALKSQITEEEMKGISEVTLGSIDTKNQKEEMEVNTGYVDSGIITPNEAREKIGLNKHNDGDILRVRGKNDTASKDVNPQDAQIAKIEESIQKIYSTYE